MHIRGSGSRTGASARCSRRPRAAWLWSLESRVFVKNRHHPEGAVPERPFPAVSGRILPRSSGTSVPLPPISGLPAALPGSKPHPGCADFAASAGLPGRSGRFLPAIPVFRAASGRFLPPVPERPGTRLHASPENFLPILDRLCPRRILIGKGEHGWSSQPARWPRSWG